MNVSNLILTPKESQEARKHLGFSQAAVANEIGINPAYLSQFETGQRILEDKFMEALVRYYISEGWEQASEPSEAVDEIYTVTDGFVIANHISDNESESLLLEYHENAAKIEFIRELELKRDFFGDIKEGAAKEHVFGVLYLCSRQYEISQILRGHSPVGKKKPAIDVGKLSTMGGYIDHLASERVKKMENLYKKRAN